MFERLFKLPAINGAGDKLGLVVTVRPGGAAPTGLVFNGNPAAFNGSHFIFATEGGTIASWSGGTSAILDYSSPVGAVYKGLAMGSVGGSSCLYATDFHNGTINVFDSAFSPHTFGAGAFVDPNLPKGYAPFNIENINGRVYVTYAKQDADKHDVPGRAADLWTCSAQTESCRRGWSVMVRSIRRGEWRSNPCSEGAIPN